jgi:negative regulator of flagellin synthesis FlgM
MIISGKPIQNVLKVYGEQNQVTKSSKSGKSQIQGKDEFILSSGAQEFGQILNSIRGISEVRQEKVNEFSKKINEGNYQVDSKSVAEKMLGNYSGS